GGDPAAEQVRQATALALVQQHKQDHQQARDDQDDRDCYGHCRSRPSGYRAQAPTASSRYRQILTTSPASRRAPATRAPSMPGWAIITAMLSALTDPPYRIRILAPLSGP